MSTSHSGSEHVISEITLPEVLDVLLKAEDESGAIRLRAEHEADEIIRRTKDQFAHEQELRLKAARTEATEQIESARLAVEREAQQIAELASKSRDSMRTHFNERAPGIIRKMAEDFAARYASRGGR